MYQQQYHQYSIQEQQIWNILYTKRVQALTNQVAAPFWEGVKALELKAYMIPDFQELNFLLKRQIGWEVVAVEEPMAPRQILARWAKGKFPALTKLRLHPDADMRLQGGQDMFTHVFCQLPWLLQPEIAGFMQRLGILSKEQKSPEGIELLWRLAQHVLFNGLLRDEAGKVTLFGAALLSNAPEGEAAMSKENSWQPLDLAEMLAMPYREKEVAERYFVLEQLADLTNLVAQLEKEGVPIVELPAEFQLIAG